MSYTRSSRSSGLLATLLALLCKYLSPCHTQLSGSFSSVQPFHQLLTWLMFSSSGALSSSMLSITSPSNILCCSPLPVYGHGNESRLSHILLIPWSSPHHVRPGSPMRPTPWMQVQSLSTEKCYIYKHPSPSHITNILQKSSHWVVIIILLHPSCNTLRLLTGIIGKKIKTSFCTNGIFQYPHKSSLWGILNKSKY